MNLAFVVGGGLSEASVVAVIEIDVDAGGREFQCDASALKTGS